MLPNFAAAWSAIKLIPFKKVFDALSFAIAWGLVTWAIVGWAPRGWAISIGAYIAVFQLLQVVALTLTKKNTPR